MNFFFSYNKYLKGIEFGTERITNWIITLIISLLIGIFLTIHLQVTKLKFGIIFTNLYRLGIS